MKILVLSDSHSSYHFMRRTIDELKPDAVIHLGDHYSDGKVMEEEYPNIPFYQDPGNCDQYREGMFEPETKLEIIGGVRLLLTHGHHYRVKTGLGSLIANARVANVAAVLFGHTHMSYCQQEEDGLQQEGEGGIAQQPVVADPGADAAEEEQNGGLHHCGDEEGHTHMAAVTAQTAQNSDQIVLRHGMEHGQQQHTQQGQTVPAVAEEKFSDGAG